MDPHCFDADPDPDPDPDPGGGIGQPKMCIPPGKILGTPLPTHHGWVYYTVEREELTNIRLTRTVVQKCPHPQQKTYFSRHYYSIYNLPNRFSTGTISSGIL